MSRQAGGYHEEMAPPWTQNGLLLQLFDDDSQRRVERRELEDSMAIVSHASGDVPGGLPCVDRYRKNFTNLHFFEFEFGANVIIWAMYSAEV